jgi:hypothetical protein
MSAIASTASSLTKKGLSLFGHTCVADSTFRYDSNGFLLPPNGRYYFEHRWYTPEYGMLVTGESTFGCALLRSTDTQYVYDLYITTDDNDHHDRGCSSMASTRVRLELDYRLIDGKTHIRSYHVSQEGYCFRVAVNDILHLLVYSVDDGYVADRSLV